MLILNIWICLFWIFISKFYFLITTVSTASTMDTISLMWANRASSILSIVNIIIHIHFILNVNIAMHSYIIIYTYPIMNVGPIVMWILFIDFSIIVWVIIPCIICRFWLSRIYWLWCFVGVFGVSWRKPLMMYWFLSPIVNGNRFEFNGILFILFPFSNLTFR